MSLHVYKSKMRVYTSRALDFIQLLASTYGLVGMPSNKWLNVRGTPSIQHFPPKARVKINFTIDFYHFISLGNRDWCTPSFNDSLSFLQAAFSLGEISFSEPFNNPCLTYFNGFSFQRVFRMLWGCFLASPLIIHRSFFVFIILLYEVSRHLQVNFDEPFD